MRRCAARALRQAAVVTVGGLRRCSAARAGTVSWNNAAGGTWSGANWTGGVGTNPPTSSDTANFGIANTYNVTLDTSPTVNSFTVAGSNVTFLNSTVGRA